MVQRIVDFSLALLWLGCHLYGYLFLSLRGTKACQRPNPAFRAISPKAYLSS